MRPSALALCVLLGCDVDDPNQWLEEAAPLAEVCLEQGSVTAGFDAFGDPCPDPGSPIGYSLLGPNVQLLVDRSASMQGERWEALQALAAYLPAVGARANLGLAVFPGLSEDRCAAMQGEVVPMSRGDEAIDPVAAGLATLEPQGRTPMADGLLELVGRAELQCTNRDNVVVMLTDGEESCGGDPRAAVRTLVASPEPIELYVVGFGTTPETNTDLKRIARAARSTTGPGNFVSVDTVEELVERLAEVTGTCVAQLDEDVSLDALRVVLDGRELAVCEADRCDGGFRHDPHHRTVTLEGEDCLALQDGTCHELIIER